MRVGMAVSALGVVALLAWVPGAHADETISVLPSNERIAASMDIGTFMPPFPNPRSDFALYGLTSSGLAPIAPDTDDIDWSPGAASLVASQKTGHESFTFTIQMEVIDFATGAVRPVNYLSVVPSGPGLHDLTAVRWDSSGAPLWGFNTAAGLFRVESDGSNPSVAASGIEPFDLSISSNGRRLAESDTGSSGKANLVVEDEQAGTSVQVTNTPTVSEVEPVLSPDQTKIAYAAGSTNLPASAANRMEVRKSSDGSGQVVVYQAPNGFAVAEPAWRPQGDRIAFVRFKRNETTGSLSQPQLMSVAATGGDERIYTPLTGDNRLPGSRVSDVSWGSTCVILLTCNATFALVRPTTGSLNLVATPTVKLGASLGLQVQRYKGTRLVPAGLVPFGPKRRGRQRLAWSLRLNGKALRAGRYRIVLRALAGTVPLELSRAVDLIVPRKGPPRLVAPRTQ